MGKQPQLDWKESIAFTLNSGEIIDVNIFVLLLSFSRFKVYRLSLSKSQDILLNFMDEAFQTFGGVPHEIVTDNMKTVMAEARTQYYPSKINNHFKQFADDYGFKILPCIAGRPRTKAEVEAPMKLLDKIRAYNGKLNYSQLNELISRINNRVNAQVNLGTGRIPVMYLAKVNHSSMFHYNGCQYSVPPEYVGKNVSLQIYDDHIHMYYSTYFVTVHTISKKIACV